MPACTCCIGLPPRPPGTTSRHRWPWSSRTCTHASRSRTSPGQCPHLLSSLPTSPQPAGSPSPLPSQVLALVHHQDLRGEPGTEGLGAAAAVPCEPHRTAETPGPRAGPAAVPAPQQGGGSRGLGGGGRGAGHRALSQWVPRPPRWTPPCGGCWSDTAALSPQTPWRCLRARSSSLPSRGELTSMQVCPRRPEKGCWVCPRVPAEPRCAHRPPRLRGGQAVLCFLFPPEEPEGGVRDHRPGPTDSSRERPGGPVGWAPRAARAKARALKPTSSSPPGVLLPGRGAGGGA